MTKLNCNGCVDDFYNRSDLVDGGRCWNLKTGKVVTRYRIGTWTMPLQPGAFTEVRVPDCYRQSGQVFTDRPHAEAVNVVRLRRSRVSK
jgi:hypothetical protein